MNALFGLIGALVLVLLALVIAPLLLAGLMLWLDGDDQDFS